MKTHKSLFSYLLPMLSILFIFGIIGNVTAKDKEVGDEVGDIIAVTLVTDYQGLPAEGDDYIYEEGVETSTPTSIHYFNGEIKKIKGCDVIFKAENGDTYAIPISDVVGYRFEDPASEMEAPLMEMIMNPQENCAKGVMDAQMYHGKFAGNFAGGLLLGVFMPIIVLATNPNPFNGNRTVMMSQNSDLFGDPYYLDCYKKQAKKQNMWAALAGWGTWMVIVVLASAAG